MFFKEPIVKHRRIHFVGIGGIGMSGIAEILLNLGYAISGSDLRKSSLTDRLDGMGAQIFEGHAAGNIKGADAVVVSSAIPTDNPELAAAGERQILVISRGELLAELMRLKYGIAIAGSHGKTTTASMAAAVLHAAEKDPTVVVGGRVVSMGSNARLGNSDFLLVEADESDGSFLQLTPILALVTSIDREHLDHYSSFQAVQDAFVEFANKVPFYGSAIAAIDDPCVRQILPRIRRRLRTYGLAPDADLIASQVECGHMKSRFELLYQGRELGKFSVQGVGEHNVLNAMGAVLVGLELEIPIESIRLGLESFRGVERRFQIRGERGGITVIDDYGHHPTEIAATLAAARHCDFKRIHVVFQPHRYSRTHLLAKDFGACFGDCDHLHVVDIYPAGELPIPGVSAEKLVEEIRASGHPAAEYVASLDEAVEKAVAGAHGGDAILTLGAGNISQAAEKIVSRLESHAPGIVAAR